MFVLFNIILSIFL